MGKDKQYRPIVVVNVSKINVKGVQLKLKHQN